MKTLAKKMIYFFQRHPLVLGSLLAFSFIMAAATSTYQYHWMWIPSVRLMLHAVSAFVLTLFFNMLGGVPIVIVIRETLGIWIVSLEKKGWITRNGTRYLRKKVCIGLWAIHLPIGTIAYIVKSYDWETYQAITFVREIQKDQLMVDILFAVIGGIFWAKYFNNFLGKKYYFTIEKSIEFLDFSYMWLNMVVITDINDFDRKLHRILIFGYNVFFKLIPILSVVLLVVTIRYLGMMIW